MISEEIPNGWALCNLGSIATFEMGQAPPGSASNFDGVGTVFVKAGEFGRERPIVREWTTQPLKFAASTDVLICVVGATAGKLNLGIDCAIGRSVAAIRPAAEIHQRLIHYQLLMQVVSIRSASFGSAQGVISKQMLDQLPIAVPPLKEQQHIADKLDTLISRIDACRGRLDSAVTLTAQFRAAVLHSAMTGTLSAPWREEQRSPSWTETVVGAVGTVSGGLTKNPKRDAMALRRPYLRVANVHANRLELDDLAEIGISESELAKTRLAVGDLLIVEGNGSIDQVGRAALWGGEIADCSHQNHLIRWRAGEHALPKFVLYWLMSPAGRAALMQRASSSSGLHTLSISKVSSVPISMPAMAEQIEIVRRVDALFAWAKATESRIAQAAAQVSGLAPATLAKAFRGELVPQDPADEPAQALLDRLRSGSEVSNAGPGSGGRRARTG